MYVSNRSGSRRNDRQIPTALRVLDPHEQERPHRAVQYRDLNESGDVEEVLSDPAVRQVKDRQAGIGRVAVGPGPVQVQAELP